MSPTNLLDMRAFLYVVIPHSGANWFYPEDVPYVYYDRTRFPLEAEWTIVIHNASHQHLADYYNMKEDVIRIKVKPETEETHQERLR